MHKIEKLIYAINLREIIRKGRGFYCFENPNLIGIGGQQCVKSYSLYILTLDLDLHMSKTAKSNLRLISFL